MLFTRAWPNRDDGEVAMLVFGDPAFYGRFGFVQAGPSGIRAPHPAEPAWGWQVLELAEGILGAPGVLQVAAPLRSAQQPEHVRVVVGEDRPRPGLLPARRVERREVGRPANHKPCRWFGGQLPRFDRLRLVRARSRI